MSVSILDAARLADLLTDFLNDQRIENGSDFCIIVTDVKGNVARVTRWPGGWTVLVEEK